MLRTPRWLEGTRLSRLLSAGSPGPREEAAEEDFRRARLAALFTLRLLSRLPGSYWKDTCLYRSAALCLVRREMGLAARLVIGARHAMDPGEDLEFHAWVEGSEGEPGSRSSYRPLRPSTGSEPSTRLQLLQSGDLVVEVPESMLSLLEVWLPRVRRRTEAESSVSTETAPGEGQEQPGQIRIVRAASVSSVPVRSGDGPGQLLAGDPTFRAGSARAWLAPGEDRAAIVSESGRFRAWVRLDARRADVVVSEGPSPRVPDADASPGEVGDAAWQLSSVLSAAAVLLLGRAGRTRLHGGAVVGPSGGAWLLVGDGGSGKSSACAALVAAGWDYLSDDQLVLAPSDDGVRVEGWDDRIHLDEGWWRQEPSGSRRSVRAASLGPGRWRSAASVEGVLLPRIRPEPGTGVVRIGAGMTLTELVRQSPWLLADPGAAEDLLDLLRDVAHRPAYRLEMGPEAFGRPEVLLQCVSGIGGR